MTLINQDSVEQSPFRESGTSSTSKEILRLVWNLKFNCHVRRDAPLVSILS